MNPEAVEWLESLDENERLRMFSPHLGAPGRLFTLKEDHESCAFCPMARRYGGELLVIG